MENLNRRVMVRDVETERFGRRYAGREGRIKQFSRNPQTGEVKYVVDVGENPAGVQFNADEVEFLD
jgi:hypothetical protein